MIKLPDDVLKAIADLHSQLVLCNRLNFCSDSLYNLEQTLIRNATAQPVSDWWVNCSERMPDKENYYLTYSNAGVDVTYFDGEIFSDKHAAHWMPLPAAPGGQDD